MPTLELEKKDLERFWSKVEKNSDRDCWLWTGQTTFGYGKFHLNLRGVRKNVRAHRISYAMLVEEIPSEVHLDHLCRVRNCVNPEHLRPVTNRENVLAGIGPTAINARKTHCKNNHPYDEENTRITKTGERRCRECVRKWSREAARRRAAREGSTT